VTSSPTTLSATCPPIAVARHDVTVAVSGGEIIALRWVADLVKSLIAAAAGDRLKTKKLSSSERASFLARELYSSLKELEEGSKDFVEALSALGDGESEARDSLQWALERVAKASNLVTRAVNGIDPQLSIHAPEIAEDVEIAHTSRDHNAFWAGYVLWQYTGQEQTDAFREAAEKARQTLSEIEAASEAFREFLTEQFKFSESF
jgi:chemotaxis regulatin CheY-phosphate phosphatase CheZ